MFIGWALAHKGDTQAGAKMVRESVNGHRDRGIRMMNRIGGRCSPKPSRWRVISAKRCPRSIKHCHMPTGPGMCIGRRISSS